MKTLVAADGQTPISSSSVPGTGLVVPEGAVKIPVYHTHHKCRRLAFYTKVRWVPGALMRSSDVVLLDGSTPSSNSPIVCGSCGKPIDRPVMDHLAYELPPLYTRRPGKKRLEVVK